MSKDYLWQKKLTDNEYHSCFCVGRQNGQPACPCKMRSLKIIDGRYVEIIDYGPVKD